MCRSSITSRPDSGSDIDRIVAEGRASADGFRLTADGLGAAITRGQNDHLRSRNMPSESAGIASACKVIQNQALSTLATLGIEAGHRLCANVKQLVARPAVDLVDVLKRGERLELVVGGFILQA